MGRKVSDGRSYSGAVAAADISAGDSIIIDGVFGFADTDALTGEGLSLSIGQEEREVVLPAKSGGFVLGDPVFWDGTIYAEDSDGGANRFIGRVTRAVAAAGGVGWILVDAQAWAGPQGSDSIQQTIIAGGTAGAHTVTGIAVGDRLISVIEMDFTDASETGADLTSEFTVSAVDEIDNTAGTDTSGGFLLVTYAAASA